MNSEEKQALKLIKQGKSRNRTEIEKRLRTDFIFFKDPFTGKYVSATKWPPE